MGLDQTIPNMEEGYVSRNPSFRRDGFRQYEASAKTAQREVAILPFAEMGLDWQTKLVTG